MLADVICNCKKQPVMALDDVTSFLHLKDVIQIQVNVCDTVKLLVEFFSAMAESWLKLKTSNVFS